MDKKAIKQRLDRILSAANNVVSVGTNATVENSKQLMGITQCVREIWALVNAPEQEGQKDG